MATKHISELKKFKAHLVVYGEWNTAPGYSGEAGLAIVKTARGYQIWTWDDENGLEEYATVEGISPRAVVESILEDDCLTSSVDPLSIVIVNAKDHWAELIAMAWPDDEDSRRKVRLLLSLADCHLNPLLEMHGVDSDEIWEVLSDPLAAVEARGLDDFPSNVAQNLPAPLTVAQIRDELLRAVNAEADKIEEEQRRREAEAERVRPFKQEADRICRIWERTHPPSRGGGMTVKALGYSSLHRYIVNWISDHGTPPSGTHRIPGGTEAFGRQAKDFDVDFDALN